MLNKNPFFCSSEHTRQIEDNKSRIAEALEERKKVESIFKETSRLLGWAQWTLEQHLNSLFGRMGMLKK
jgi:hypothetical protein